VIAFLALLGATLRYGEAMERVCRRPWNREAQRELDAAGAHLAAMSPK
jgi:hypothetical protein